MNKLKDRVAVITGGTRGFGLEIARAFLEEGASVVIASRGCDSVNRALESLRVPGRRLFGMVIAIRDRCKARMRAVKLG